MKKIISIFIVFVLVILYFSTNKTTLSYLLGSFGYDVSIEYLGYSEIVTLDNEVNCDDLLRNLNLEIYSKDIISDRIVIEGYTSKINKYILINGKKTNIQISISDDEFIIGTPLIKNSFWLDV